MSLPVVYILLLNYRNADATLACLDSLRALDYPNARILLIDNASGDNSLMRFETRLQKHPGEFQLIVSPINGGFSAGNNLGINYALEQAGRDDEAYVWILNNDTTVEAGALKALVAESQRTGGVCGSLLLHPDGSFQQVGTRINWWIGGTKGYKESGVTDHMSVDALSGASMLVPLSAVRKAGLMNEAYFLYFEDGEYSTRFKRKGIPCTVATGSRVFHAEGATTGKTSLATQYYYQRNRLKLLFSYANPLQIITITLYAFFRFARTVVKSWMRPTPERKASADIYCLAVWDFMKGVGGPCPHNLQNLQNL